MKSKILFILHLPPPIHGANMVGNYIKESRIINEAFECKYINITTSKQLNKSGRGGIKKMVVILKLYFKVFIAIIKKKYDLYYLTINSNGHGFYKDFGIVLLLKLFRCKIIYHYHNKGIVEGQNNWLLNLMYRVQFKNSDTILLSPLLYPDTAKYLARDKAFYCANGIPEIQGIDLKLINSKRAQKTVPELLFLSNMMKEKGVFVLLEAARILSSKNIPFKLTFIGGWVDITEAEFNRFVSSNNLNRSVFYMGLKYGAEKNTYLENADIFVFPTFYHNETFGLVNLEAMQFGLPIISTNEGAIPDIVSENKTGYLVNKQDAKDLADKLQYLIENPDLRRKMGEAAKRKFEELYRLNTFENNLIKILKTVITRKKVIFLYKFLPQYRVDFFELLKSTLLKYNVELQLIYGKSKYDNALKKDEVEIDWAKFVPNKFYRVGKIQFIWQPCLKYIKDANLLIVQPENKLLLNHYLMLGKYFSKYKFSFWGHGRNMQMNVGSFPNRIKSLYLNKCDWWFAYTEGVAKVVQEHHFPKNKITIVQNAIDTLSLRKYYAEINETEINELKDQLGITGCKTGIYCGGMYAEKKIDFIVETCHRIKKEIPDFHMIFIGSGIDSHKVIQASTASKWIHYVGPKFGQDRIKYFKISSIQLMPGLVGLGILDSFALETPIVTTRFTFHSPEIDYLQNGINGIITNNDLDDYAQTVIDMLKTGKYLDLIEGCKLSAKKYTVEAMVDNFKNGILTCLKYEKN